MNLSNGWPMMGSTGEIILFVCTAIFMVGCALGVLFLIALAIIWLTDKGEPEEIPASEREYTGFEDGFPVPPLPGQTPVASPRGLATIEGELAPAAAIDSPKESTDE